MKVNIFLIFDVLTNLINLMKVNIINFHNLLSSRSLHSKTLNMKAKHEFIGGPDRVTMHFTHLFRVYELFLYAHPYTPLSFSVPYTLRIKWLNP